MKDNFQELISPLVLTLDTSASIASGIIIVNKKRQILTYQESILMASLKVNV